MAHFFTTPAMTGSGDTIRFGSLEYPALSPVGMRVPPIFEPSQAFLFGSLDFVADRLGVLHLREETRDLASIGGTSSIDSGTRDFNGATSALHSLYLLSPTDHPEGLHRPHHKYRTIGSPMASHPPWMLTLRGSKGRQHHPHSRPDS